MSASMPHARSRSLATVHAVPRPGPTLRFSAAAPAFWPPGVDQHVTFVDLPTHRVPRAVEPFVPDLQELAALGDGVRALQTADGTYLNRAAATELLRHSSRVLARIARGLPGPLAEVIVARARELETGSRLQLIASQVALDEDPLVIRCGPMAGWRTRTAGAMHGVIASYPVAALNQMIATADRLVDDGDAFLRDFFDRDDLFLSAPPAFMGTRLLACGGEPNTYPKHFAYFFPEDEGARLSAQKTVLFADVYERRFDRISGPLAVRLLRPARTSVARDDAGTVLPLWFRGHDIGHGLRTAPDGPAARRVLAVWDAMVLDETLADVVGYALLGAGPWGQKFGIDATAAGRVFLGELLRYLRRGLSWFPDSDAAMVELGYLVAGGFVRVERGDGRLEWNAADLLDGLEALGKELVAGLFGHDLPRLQRLLSTAAAARDGMLRDFFRLLRDGCRDIPTTLAYNAVVLDAPPPEHPRGPRLARLVARTESAGPSSAAPDGRPSSKQALLSRWLSGDAVPLPSGSVVITRRPPGQPAPFSLGQLRILESETLRPGRDTTYNLFYVFRLRGALDVAVLRRALGEIVARHEVLRLRAVSAADGTFRLLIDREVAVAIPVEDLGGLPADVAEAQAREQAEASGTAPFDLAAGPVFRLRLYRLQPGDHVMLMAIHHIAFDEWSMGVVLRELQALYTAFSTGRPSPLAPLPIQYGDYAYWEGQWLQGVVLERQRAFWRETLDETLPVHWLPGRRSAPREPFTRGQFPIVMPRSLTDAVKAYSRRQRVSPFSTLLAAFTALIHWLTGAQDVVVGNPLANRHRTGLEGLIGFLVNSLPTRTSVAGDPTFDELVRRTVAAGRETYRHREFPYSWMADVRPGPLRGVPPLQVVFSFQNSPLPALRLPGLTLDPVTFDYGLTTVEVALYLIDAPVLTDAADTYAGMLRYNASLYDAGAMHALWEDFQQVLHETLARPGRRLSQLSPPTLLAWAGERPSAAPESGLAS
jgi:Condensation domain